MSIIYYKQYKNFLPEEYIKAKNKERNKSMGSLIVILFVLNLFMFIDYLNIKSELDNIKLQTKINIVNEEDSILNKYDEIYTSLTLTNEEGINGISISNGLVSVELDNDNVQEKIKILDDIMAIYSIDYLDDEFRVVLGGDIR